MDVTLFGHLALAPDAAHAAVLDVARRCRRFRGTLGILWHNDEVLRTARQQAAGTPTLVAAVSRHGVTAARTSSPVHGREADVGQVVEAAEPGHERPVQLRVLERRELVVAQRQPAPRRTAPAPGTCARSGPDRYTSPPTALVRSIISRVELPVSASSEASTSRVRDAQPLGHRADQRDVELDEAVHVVPGVDRLHDVEQLVAVRRPGQHALQRAQVRPRATRAVSSISTSRVAWS